MSERTAVLVTGSRDWRDPSPIRVRLAYYPRGTILLHGDCGRYEDSDNPMITAPLVIGADKLAALACSGLGIRSWALPYFSDLGKAGGPVRNDTLIDVLEVLWRRGFTCSVEAFPIGRSAGTRGCLFAAQARNRRLDSGWSFHVTEGVLDAA